MQVKEAVQKASQYLPDVFETAANKELRLEGVEKTDDGRFWRVTFSYDSSSDRPSSFTSLLRAYKTVKIRDDNGEFIGANDGNLLGGL